MRRRSRSVRWLVFASTPHRHRGRDVLVGLHGDRNCLGERYLRPPPEPEPKAGPARARVPCSAVGIGRRPCILDTITRRWECASVASVEVWLPWASRSFGWFDSRRDSGRGRRIPSRAVVGGKHDLYDRIWPGCADPRRPDGSCGDDALDGAFLDSHVGRSRRDRGLANRAAASDWVVASTFPRFRRAALGPRGQTPGEGARDSGRHRMVGCEESGG